MFSVGERVCRINSQLDTGTVIYVYDTFTKNEVGMILVKWDGAMELEEVVSGHEIKLARRTA